MSEKNTEGNAEKVKPGSVENGWSSPEKEIMMQIYSECDKLDYPLAVKRTSSGAQERVYIIPEDQMEKVAASLWPFEGSVPASDEELFDIHSSSTFLLKKCKAIRCMGRNMLVSPEYLKSGGMLVDIVPKLQLDNSDWNGFAYTIKNGGRQTESMCVTGVNPERKQANA